MASENYSVMAGVGHSYCDYANVTENYQHLVSANLNGSATASSSQSGTEGSFPLKLHHMISELERTGLDDIISWLPHGRCFAVHKQKEFVEEILPS
jgi:hypothetical protein